MEECSPDERKLQEFYLRSPVDPLSTSETLTIPARWDAETGYHVVLLDDARIIFKDALHFVDHGDIIPFMKGDDSQELVPLRIKHRQGVTLEAVTNTAPARIGRYDPFIGSMISSRATGMSGPQDIIKKLTESMYQEVSDDGKQMLQMEELVDEWVSGEHGGQEAQSNSQEMEQYILEKQQQILQVQQQSIDRLVAIQEDAQNTMALAFSGKDSLFPRLFIVLPIRLSRWSTSDEFRIFFLCEHRHPSKVSSPTIHLARQEGYKLADVERFFEIYGPYVVLMTRILKNGITSPGLNIPCLSHLTLGEDVEIRNFIDLRNNTIQSLMNETISYIHDQGYDASMSRMSSESALDMLESTDIQSIVDYLEGFTRKGHTLGMNQVVTSDVVHWICAEHFTNRQHEIAEDHQDEDTDEEDHKGNFDEEQWLLDEQTEAVDHHGLHYNVWTEREKLVLSLHGKVEQEATALQELIKAVSDRHASVREAAIRVLRGPSKGGSRPALQAVIEAVKDSQWNVQEAALQVLGDQKQLSFKLVTVLIASAAGSWHLHVMRAAKDALIKHVSSGSIHQCLVDILLSGATVEKVVAIEVLATDVKLPESAIEALIMELESDTQDIRSAAVYALQRQSKLSELTIQKLSSIAKNGPLNVRKAAIRVLGSQISVSATLTLSECLKDESEDVLIATVQALRPNSQLPQSTVRQLMKALSHEHVEVREAVAEALGGQISLSEATKQTLVNLLNNDTPSVKEAFVQAIGNRMQQSVIDALVGIPEDRGPGASRTTGYSSEIKRELHEPPIQGPKSRTWEKQQSPATETQDRLRHDMIREIDFKDVTNIQPLKRGGFGEIRTAEWSRLRVILKMGFSNHTDGKMQFDQELEVLKRVQGYDYIIPLYGVTTDPHTNVRWMVMKYCPNGNLAMFLEKHYEDLTWLERYRICSEVTKGLEFLHKSGFHHRDLHSGNILLDDKRTAMLCDFGLSRSSSRDQTTEVGATVGVASFLAPERFPAQRPAYTAACDIYSLGVTFWHISSGRIPFVSRLRDPKLLRELMDGLREEFIPGTPREFRDLIVKCWDKEPSKRLEIDVVIAILQTLMAKSSGPLHQMRSEKASRALPVPPDLDSKMANLERASNMLNRMVFDIRDPVMKETVDYIERTRAYFRDRSLSQKPYTPSNPPKTPIYMCPLVGDIAALRYYLSQGGYYREPINESSEQTGDTSLHLACLFLESPMDTIKVLVELGADINLENLQGYTPLMILVSSNTQHCYEAVMYLRMRGARIPSYIRNPITPLNNAQLYALNALNEFAQTTPSGWDIKSPTNGTSRTWPEIWLSVQDTVQKKSEKEVYQLSRYDQPLIHVIAAMQDDYRILDCVWEAGLDPTVSVAGITTLVAAAAHLRIGNIEWLLNNHVEVSTETNVQKAIDVVKMIHVNPLPAVDPQRGSSGSPFLTDVSTMDDTVWHELLSGIRDIRKYSWAGVASGEADGLRESMVDLVLDLLEQWIGDRGLANRWDVVTKFNVTYGSLLPLAGKSDVKGVNVDRLERVHLQLKRAVGKILGNPTASSTPSEAPPSYYP